MTSISVSKKKKTGNRKGRSSSRKARKADISDMDSASATQDTMSVESFKSRFLKSLFNYTGMISVRTEIVVLNKVLKIKLL